MFYLDFTGLVTPELESIIYQFSLIFRVFIAFLKNRKVFNSSDTKVSSAMFSSLSSRVI